MDGYMSNSIYSREPLSYEGSIPIFSFINEYVENYEKISADHLRSLRDSGTNPFIPEDIWRQLENSTIELIEKYSHAGEMILDVGVGLGRLLSHFPQLQRFGNDISLGYLEVAQSKGIEVCFSLIEDMPYEPESFDVVTCTDVLEHVIDLNLSIKKILEPLKKGGTLIIRVPYRENLIGYFDAPYKFIHLRNFDEFSLRLYIEKVFGCEYIETTFSGYIPNGDYLKWQIPYLQKVIFSPLVSIVGLLDKRTKNDLIKKSYNPIDMNLVLRKR